MRARSRCGPALHHVFALAHRIGAIVSIVSRWDAVAVRAIAGCAARYAVPVRPILRCTRTMAVRKVLPVLYTAWHCCAKSPVAAYSDGTNAALLSVEVWHSERCCAVAAGEGRPSACVTNPSRIRDQWIATRAHHGPQCGIGGAAEWLPIHGRKARRHGRPNTTPPHH